MIDYDTAELKYINGEPVFPPEQEETAAKYLNDALQQDLAKGDISREWWDDLFEFARVGSRTARKILVACYRRNE